MIAMLVVSAMVSMAMWYLIDQSKSLNVAGAAYDAQNYNAQVGHELEIVFSNPALCQNLVLMSGSNFTISESGQSLFSSLPKGATVVTMKIEDPAVPIAPPTGYTQKDFVVTTQLPGSNDPQRANRVSIFYKPGATGKMADCQPALTAHQACEQLGISWAGDDSGGGRCTICEKMGGLWQPGVGGGSGKCVPH